MPNSDGEVLAHKKHSYIFICSYLETPTVDFETICGSFRRNRSKVLCIVMVFISAWNFLTDWRLICHFPNYFIFNIIKRFRIGANALRVSQADSRHFKSLQSPTTRAGSPTKAQSFVFIDEHFMKIILLKTFCEYFSTIHSHRTQWDINIKWCKYHEYAPRISHTARIPSFAEIVGYTTWLSSDTSCSEYGMN